MKKSIGRYVLVLCCCVITTAGSARTITNDLHRDSVPPLRSDDFIHTYGRLDNFYYRVQHDKETTVAFLGGSITNMKGWRDKVMQYLQTQYPATRFTFINAGIPSLGSLPHVFRVQRDVLQKGKIDLMFIESAVNDHVNGTPVEQQRRSLEGVIRHAYAANPYMNMVMMAFVDEDKIADYNAGKTPVEVQVHDEIAAYYHLPFINLAAEVTKRIAGKEFTWKDDFKNLHPSPFGQELYFTTIKRLLEKTMNGRQPSAFKAATLPVALQKWNYSHGMYQPVASAAQLNKFTVQQDWTPKDSIHTREGFVHVPVREGEQPGASFQFSFTGTAVGIAVVSGPDVGILEYTIDGQPVQSIDLYTQWSGGLHLPRYLLLGDELDKKQHSLKVTISAKHNPQSKGTASRVVYFLVNGRNVRM